MTDAYVMLAKRLHEYAEQYSNVDLAAAGEAIEALQAKLATTSRRRAGVKLFEG